MTGDLATAASSRRIYAFRRNLVLAASAGTGKTHALVGVAVHVLLGACQGKDGGLRDPILPDALVATTFSRKAAGEIRERLRGELEKLAAGDPAAAYLEDLDAACQAVGTTPLSREEIAARARRALGRLGRAQIGTLHSFAVAIVRAHALAAGLSPSFELLDEETHDERVSDAIARVIERRGESAEVAALLQIAGGALPFIDQVKRMLDRVGNDGIAPEALVLAETDAADIEAEFQELIAHARALEDDKRLGGAARAVGLAFQGGDVDLFCDAVAALCEVSRAGKLSPSAEAWFEYRETMAEGSPATTNPERGRAAVRQWQAKDELLPRARCLKEILSECAAVLAEDNARDAVLSFADVLCTARDLLRDHPAIALETGASIDALLVDEFQDTSGVQRDLVQLLWEKEPGKKPGRTGHVPGVGDLRAQGLLIVGDRKQSIYGFRGADPALFAELCVGLAGTPARVALAVPAGVVSEPEEPSADFIALRHNRRGAPELLAFANAWSQVSLVPNGSPAELFEVDYVAATEDLLPPTPSALPKAESSTRTHWLRTAVPPKARATAALQDADVMAARISCLVRGRELTVRGAPVRWGDIAILAQKHSMLAAAAYALARDGIPHVVAGMDFYGLREVRDVVAMLASLALPEDSLALIEVLRGPWAAVTDRTLVGLTDLHQGIADVARWQEGERRHLVAPEDRAAVQAVADVLLALRPALHRMGVGAALREAVRALHLEETLLVLSRGEQRVANVRKLLALADDARDPVLFLRRLRRRAAFASREGEAATFSEDEDAVRLLTVHASKGLAFPVVFLPEAGAAVTFRAPEALHIRTGVASFGSTLVLRGADGSGLPFDPPSFTRAKRDHARREAAERKRLRYVAVTRPSEALYFVGDRAIPKSGRAGYETSTASTLATLCEREEGRLDVETGDSLRRKIERERPAALVARGGRATLPDVGPREVVVDFLGVAAAAHCRRRFQLTSVRGVGSPARASTNFRPLRELVVALAEMGAWGARIARENPRLLLHEPLAFSIPADEGPSVVALGTADLTVVWADGSVDVVVGAVPPSDLGVSDLQASLLAHATRLRHEAAVALRVGFVPAWTGAVPPRWTSPCDLTWTREALRSAVANMVATAPNELAPRVSPSFVSVSNASSSPTATLSRALVERIGNEA